MPYVRAWADNSRQSLLRLTTSAAPVDMLTLSGGGAECAYGAGFLAGWSDSGSRPRWASSGPALPASGRRSGFSFPSRGAGRL